MRRLRKLLENPRRFLDDGVENAANLVRISIGGLWVLTLYEYLVSLFRLDERASSLSLAGNTRGHVDLGVVTQRRGYQRCGRIAVFTRHPLGLFRVWSWISPDRQLLVYPAIDRDGPPLPLPSTDGNRRWRRSTSRWSRARSRRWSRCRSAGRWTISRISNSSPAARA